MNRIFLISALVLALAFAAWAGVDGPGIHSIEGDAVFHENNAGEGVAVLNVVAGAADDTGDEVCAAIGMTCGEVWGPITLGVDADITDSTCATDVADTSVTLVFCL